MIQAFKIFLFLFINSLLLYSQSDQIKTFDSKDSLNINVSPLTEIQIKFDEFELYPELNNLKPNIPIESDPKTVWLRTSLAVSNIKTQGINNTPHYLFPLYAHHMEDSKFNPFRYVLGIAQVGAVGYLAYQHIKKYGFLK